jgi:acetyl-CoA carboxylase biotin carboxylase subunit
VEIDGVHTNLPMHIELVQQPEFVAGGVDTAWFPRFLGTRVAAAARSSLEAGMARG